MQYVELLAPAKDLECGMAAINHGADAVYIGAPRFGARSAAGNSLYDIEKLIGYSHKYRAKVFIAFNTILYNHELEEAREQILRIYEMGADALIVQDMGILEMDLPPIHLHASTQTDNRSLEKVKFLEKAGFQRAVLARELSLEQINKIRAETKLELEYFVNGALCVSYSGQCYFSHAVCGRSANRGECAQPCRMTYSLQDSRGNIIEKNKHLLSLKDLNLSANLDEIVKAGVCSLKIEGRLKDISYVKNTTAFYRQKIDSILEGSNKFKKASSGKCNFFFNPDSEKTFNRGFTDYFFNGRKENIASFNTPKSLGKKLGVIEKVEKNYFLLNTTEKISNGDGLCFFNHKNKLSGVKINRVEGRKLFPADIRGIFQGVEIYRNYDHEFTKILKGKTSERKVDLDMELTEVESGIKLIAVDEDHVEYSATLDSSKEIAKNSELALKNIKKQLNKTGDTIFSLRKLKINLGQIYFIPMGELNQLRRELLINLEKKRLDSYKKERAVILKNNISFGEDNLDYRGNISNDLAKNFYKRHQVKNIEDAFERLNDFNDKIIMTTKHCLKYDLKICPKLKKTDNIKKLKIKEPLFLIDQNRKYKLDFDCKNCEMNILI